jgi:hypothetical protein
MGDDTTLLTAEETICQMCGHKLTDHWKGGCSCTRDGGMIIECTCVGYFPQGVEFTGHSYSKFSVGDAKTTILIELGY